jgi:hypothetical protein
LSEWMAYACVTKIPLLTTTPSKKKKKKKILTRFKTQVTSDIIAMLLKILYLKAIDVVL